MQNMFRLAGVFVIALTIGCGGGVEGPEEHATSGSVSLDGSPIAKGEILFEDSTGAVAGSAVIENGKYETTVAAGKLTVRINAPKEVGEADETGLVPTEETIPAKYNTESELEVEIKEGENKDVNFELTS